MCQEQGDNTRWPFELEGRRYVFSYVLTSLFDDFRNILVFSEFVYHLATSNDACKQLLEIFI